VSWLSSCLILGVAGRRPPRVTGFDYVGLHAYFLTICTDRRQRALANGTLATEVRTKLLECSAAYRFAVTAYCLMPDHLHGLFEASSEDSDFRRFVAMCKQRTAFAYRQQTRRRLWQDGYCERILRDDEPVIGIAAYIVHNPLRAHLCERLEEYPFVGSDRYGLSELIDAVQFRPDWRRSRP
jgi:putative transposase